MAVPFREIEMNPQRNPSRRQPQKTKQQPPGPQKKKASALSSIKTKAQAPQTSSKPARKSDCRGEGGKYASPASSKAGGEARRGAVRKGLNGKGCIVPVLWDGAILSKFVDEAERLAAERAGRMPALFLPFAGGPVSG